MSAVDRVAPTRLNLLRARARLARVRKGAQIVRRKREALVAHLFQLVRPAISSREAIERKAQDAYGALAGALAVHGRDGLRAIAWPERRMTVEVHPAQIWGVAVADVGLTEPLRRTLDARGTPPGSTGPSTTIAADRFEALAELLIASAPNELRVSRLADAVAQTSHQLHVLEREVEPKLLARIARLARTLEEREREAHLALKRLRRARNKA